MNAGLIKRRLLELGMSREALAVKIGRSSSTVNSVLAGKRVGDKTVIAIAHALEVKPSELLVANAAS